MARKNPALIKDRPLTVQVTEYQRQAVEEYANLCDKNLADVFRDGLVALAKVNADFGDILARQRQVAFAAPAPDQPPTGELAAVAKTLIESK